MSESKTYLGLYNLVMQSVKADKVTSYEDIFVPCKNKAVCYIKIKLIQEMIQIERPKNWNIENIKNMIVNMANMENFMANKSNNLNKYKIQYLFANIKISKITCRSLAYCLSVNIWFFFHLCWCRIWLFCQSFYLLIHL
jgi:hypothetical protein